MTRDEVVAMQSRIAEMFVTFHDRRLRQQVNDDEQGLSLVAYALGAAFIVVPMAIALFVFGQQSTARADTELAGLLSASSPSFP